ncbi:hypothetical protein SDC9_181324 [bioreactor metagenome]|uniref:Uncharacterized protein n=1 Tax=bioreactor metagenome TaxID=1076179 RepID=A0A645H663_9ZZZZ
MVDTIAFSVRPDVAHGRLGRFLHHVAELTGQRQMAGALHNRHLYCKHLAAYARNGQAVAYADLVLTGERFALKLLRAEIRPYFSRRHAHAFFAFGDLARRFAAYGRDHALKLTYARFGRV